MPEYKFFYPKKILVRSNSVRSAINCCHRKYPKQPFFIMQSKNSNYVYYVNKSNIKLVARVPKQTGASHQQKEFNFSLMSKSQYPILKFVLPNSASTYLKSELISNILKSMISGILSIQDEEIPLENIIFFIEPSAGQETTLIDLYLTIVGCSAKSLEDVFRDNSIKFTLNNLLSKKTGISSSDIIVKQTKVIIFDFYESYRPFSSSLYHLNKIIQLMMSPPSDAKIARK